MQFNRRVAIAANVALAFPRPAKAAVPIGTKTGRADDRFEAVLYDVEDVMADVEALNRKVAEMDLSLSILVVQITLTGLFVAFFK